MGGDQELLRLAQLLRLCAETAISIARIRCIQDESEIAKLSEAASGIASEMEAIVARKKVGSSETDGNGINH